MSFRDIRHAQQAVWPTVMDSLDRHREARNALRGNPNATVAAKARARIPWNRVVANETVWGLAKQGRLVLPEQAAVVQAARDWVKSWEDYDIAQIGMDPWEKALYDAVRALATATDGPPEDAA